jgi:hypothetical protein
MSSLKSTPEPLGKSLICASDNVSGTIFVRRIIGVLLVFFCTISTRAEQMNWAHAGALFDIFSPTLSEGNRLEMLGPFFYSEWVDSQRVWGIPPLCWAERNRATDSQKFVIGYPVFSFNRYGTEFRWQLIQVLSFSGGNQPENGAKRFTIFPIYFWQRSPDTNLNYTAVFPFYGEVKNRLFADDVFAVMFPIYARVQKADVVTKHYFFPFVHVRDGNALHGWKVLPIAGHEHKDPTTKTNGFGETEIVPGHDTRFIAAPFYFHAINGIGSDNPQTNTALLPIFSKVRSPKRDSTTVAWPFVTHVIDREKNYREWQTPWPIIEFARGPGKTTSRVFPFYSHAQNTNLESAFIMWPLWKMNRLQAETIDRKRTRIALFFYSDTYQKNKETGHFSDRKDMWPFFTYKRDYNGNERLQVIAPLEPILPFSESVEREYSPVWSFWRAEKNPATGARSQSLFWNLFRHETRPDSKKCSLLFGLFQYQSNSAGKQMRIFFVPVLKSKAPKQMAGN